MNHLQIIIDRRWIRVPPEVFIRVWENKGSMPIRRDMLPKLEPGSIVLCFANRPKRLVGCAVISELDFSDAPVEIGLRSPGRYQMVPVSFVLTQLLEDCIPTQRGPAFRIISKENVSEFLVRASEETAITGAGWASYANRVSDYTPERRVTEFASELVRVAEERRESKYRRSLDTQSETATQFLHEIILRSPKLLIKWDEEYAYQTELELSFGEIPREDVSRPSEADSEHIPMDHSIESVFGTDPLTQHPEEASFGALARFIDQHVLRPFIWLDQISSLTSNLNLDATSLDLDRSAIPPEETTNEDIDSPSGEGTFSIGNLFERLPPDYGRQTQRIRTLLVEAVRQQERN